MNEELQNSEVTAEDLTQSQETENLERDQGAELAPDSETQHEEKAEADVNQDAVQKAINKQHAKYREEERKRLEAEEKLAEYQRKEQELQAQRFSNLPEKPDPFDDDYETKFAAYERALSDKAKFDAQQELVQQQQLQQQQLEQAQTAEQNRVRFESYVNKANELGISNQEIELINQGLIANGLTNESLAIALMEDAEGPLLAKYLSANPVELDALQNLNPFLAADKMAEIKEKAQALKPKTSNTPPPAAKVDQQAVDPEAGQLKFVKGGTFD